MHKLKHFLEQKGAEYAPFDPKRAPRLLKQLKLSFGDKIIVQIIGTNGKGSTGRFLALILKNLGLKVGHFTSPHLLSLCERFWVNGENVAESVLESAFTSLDIEVLKGASYFEVLTFLGFKVFSNCEVVILEAGLGGEYDSTTTCSVPNLTLFTNIGIDHEEFLGKSIKEIATTKLNAMAKVAVLGVQREKSIASIAEKIAKEKNAKLVQIKEISQVILEYIKTHNYPSYQAQNLALAWAGLIALSETKRIPYNTDFNLDSALKSLLATLSPFDLQGRFQILTPNICLDVLHNTDSAMALLEHYVTFSKNKTILIYNSYSDKNPKAILSLLKPIIARVEIFVVENPRMIKKSILEQILQELAIPYCDFVALKKESQYLVCGSFSVVAKFLKDFEEKRIMEE
ncbi:bifunctional folylpolyglutamate synthase/dihydrofolate synthase [Helicobacter sp. Faydin-H64]|uniref:Bifunctional folylpolyglutamate synthase/dihydrofolate synthase n=2 Tax=Helicobacter turcicus TaxID=2867412 RepID=A0ABS7JPN7_9HELI|nr:bifunctional folylpolyglutamate synthase/dihydrofolate synthase [Helicobacter turcicus]MBX7546186.1 bifunctional folylpolyglutamate synthase/dihydrofolate synthase [Helicobacter turcicus]